MASLLPPLLFIGRVRVFCEIICLLYRHEGRGQGLISSRKATDIYEKSGVAGRWPVQISA